MNLEQVFAKTHLLPTIPRVVQELIDSFGQDDIDIGGIAKKLSVDQVLTAKVLRLANSAHYGATRQIGSVDEAVVVLGFNSLRTLVIATGISGSFVALNGLDREQFWRHSLHAASISRWLAGRCTPRLNSELAFTAALMHGIGQLLLHLVFPEESARLQRLPLSSRVAERQEVEQTALGLDHCQVGAELARRWNFPEDIVRAIAQYAKPQAFRPLNPYAVVTHLGVYIANVFESGGSSDDLKENYPAEVCDPFGLGVDKIAAAWEELHALSQALDGML